MSWISSHTAAAPTELVSNRGTVDRIAGFLLSTTEAGADELLIGFQQTTATTATPDELLDVAEAMVKALGS